MREASSRPGPVRLSAENSVSRAATGDEDVIDGDPDD
jgi:hypothetical protein